MALLVGTAAHSAWSKCQTDAIVYERSTGFNLDLNSDGSGFSYDGKMTVNIPMVINGEEACYHQKNGIGIKTEKVKERELVQYEITPMFADFENVPDAKIYQYLNIDFEVNKASSLQMVSFLCSGETPIGGDAFIDSLKKIYLNKEPGASVNGRQIIAIGAPAQNIERDVTRKVRQTAFKRFLEIYEDRGGEEIATSEANITIPSVITEFSLSSTTSVDRKLYSAFYSRTGSMVNGCSSAFRETMKDLLIENVAHPHFELKKKSFSSKYRLTIKL